MTTKRILITGGAGFIGSHLSDTLLDQGYAVRILDNLSTGKLENLRMDHSGLEFMLGSVADAQVVAKAIEGCQAVVHLAAVASVQASVDDPVGTHQANFIGTLNVCEAMRIAGLKRIVFASSAAIYGDSTCEVIQEEQNKAPLTPYASDKLSSEHYLEFYKRAHGLDPVIFRFFNIFGPRQDPSSPYSGVISIFCQRALNGLPITVFGDGNQTRDFYYVTDLVRVLCQGLDLENSPHMAFNVGHCKSTSLNMILTSLAEVLDKELEIRFVDARPGDIRHSKANNDRLTGHFALDAQTSLIEGLTNLLIP